MGSCGCRAVEKKEGGRAPLPFDAVNRAAGAQEERQRAQPHWILERDVLCGGEADVVQEAVAREDGVDH